MKKTTPQGHDVTPITKRNALLEKGRFVPLIKLAPGLGVPMIKEQDLDFLNAINRYLSSRGADQLYLGGSAPENWLYEGKQKYGDLDLLAANSKRDLSRKYVSLVKELDKIGDGRTPHEIKAGMYAFVKDETLGDLYMNVYRNDPVKMGKTFRFVQIPEMSMLDTEKTPDRVVRASPIEVSFFMGSDIERTMIELQGQELRGATQ